MVATTNQLDKKTRKLTFQSLKFLSLYALAGESMLCRGRWFKFLEDTNISKCEVKNENNSYVVSHESVSKKAFNLSLSLKNILDAKAELLKSEATTPAP